MQHLGKEIRVEIGGEVYTLSRFTRRILDQFLDWADSQIENPLDTIKDRLQYFPENIQEIMVKEAMAQARLRRSVNNPEIQALMATPAGVMKILALLFQKNHPELTDLDVENLYEQSCIEHGENYIAEKIAETSGQMPKDEAEIEREYLASKNNKPIKAPKKK